MARSFNGTSDAISCANSAALRPASAITLSAWLYFTGNPSAGNSFYSIMMMPSSATWTSPFAYWALRLENSVNTSVTLQARAWINNGGVSTNFVTGHTVFSANIWYHVAITFDGSTLLLYVNGVQDGTTTLSASISTSTQPMLIGTHSGGGDYFQGRLACCGVWNVALAVQEIAALAQGARPTHVRAPSLVGYWPLDGLSSPEPDFSGNANNGTLTGTSLGAGPPVAMFTPRWSQFHPAASVPPSQAVTFDSPSYFPIRRIVRMVAV